MTLPTIQANVWEEITKVQGFFFCRNGDKIMTRARKIDLEACWDLLKEEFARLSEVWDRDNNWKESNSL